MRNGNGEFVGTISDPIPVTWDDARRSLITQLPASDKRKDSHNDRDG